MAIKKIDDQVEEVVDVVEEKPKPIKLPDNIFITQNGSRLLYNSGSLPANILQELITKVFLKANIDNAGRPKDTDKTGDRLETADAFLGFMKDILVWGTFTMYDPLPTDSKWVKRLKRTETFRPIISQLDFSDPDDVELAYIMFFCVMVDDLESIIELVNT